MPIASYHVTKVAWLTWRWEIERNGRPVAVGYSCSQGMARRRARARLRAAPAGRERPRGGRA
jgi:hypothetical protein